MVEPGTTVRDASVWTAPHVQKTVQELLADGRALFLFYLFDFSST
jgi:hypothetical protein